MGTKRGICAGLLAAGLIAGPAAAAGWDDRPDYDRRIEEAAIERLQGKLGAFRGPIGLTIEGHIFPPLGMRGAASPWRRTGGDEPSARIVWG